MWAIAQVKKTSPSAILLWWGLICNHLYLWPGPLQLHQHLGLESWQEYLGSAPGGSGNFITFSTRPACLRKAIYGREQNQRVAAQPSGVSPFTPTAKAQTPSPQARSSSSLYSKTQNPQISATGSCCNIYWPPIPRGTSPPLLPTAVLSTDSLWLPNEVTRKKNPHPSTVRGAEWLALLLPGSRTCSGLLQPVPQVTLAVVPWHSSTFHFSFERSCNSQSWQGQGVKNLSALQFILERAHTKCSSAGFIHLLIRADVRISGDLVENRLTWRDSEICTETRTLPEKSLHLVIAKFSLQTKNPPANNRPPAGSHTQRHLCAHRIQSTSTGARKRKKRCKTQESWLHAW